MFGSNWLPTGSAKTALLPAILGDVNAGGGGAPIERENEGEMEHFVTIEKRKRNDIEKGKFVQVENKNTKEDDRKKQTKGRMPAGRRTTACHP